MTSTQSINAFIQPEISFGYSSNRDFIITEAFRKIGALGDGETLDATRLSIGAGVLNPMVKALASFGLNIWTLDRVIIPFSYWNGNNNIVIGPSGDFKTLYKPLKLHEVSRIADGTDVPLQVSSNREYEQQTDKSSVGVPNIVYYKPMTTYGLLYLWQIPDTYWSSNGSLVCIFQRQIGDLNTSTDVPDFPAEWVEALIYNLAARLAPNYGLPPNDRNILKQEAKEALALVLASDQEEGSLFITVEN